jgi:hypothetical protein
MANLDDEQFERYLKTFRPAVPEPLIVPHRKTTTRRSFAIVVWGLAGAGVLIAGLFIAQLRIKPISMQPAPNLAEVARPADRQPLTLGTANALFAHEETVKTALDQIAFPSPSTQLPPGKQSALAVLSQDDRL